MQKITGNVLNVLQAIQRGTTNDFRSRSVIMGLWRVSVRSLTSEYLQSKITNSKPLNGDLSPRNWLCFENSPSVLPFPEKLGLVCKTRSAGPPGEKRLNARKMKNDKSNPMPMDALKIEYETK